MQLYTHAAAGVCGALVLYPDVPAAQTAFIFGSVLPDLSLFAYTLNDVRRGKRPFADEKPFGPWFVAKEVLHSPLLWLLGLFIAETVGGRAGTAVSACSFGILSHWVLDLLSHGGKEFEQTDQSLSWPFHQAGLAPKLAQALEVWEYRRNPPSPVPKTPELVLLTVLVLVSAYVLTAR